jgi:hypothetical protein
MYSYIVAIMDKVTQEPRMILVKGEDVLDKVMRIRPEHHILSSVQNLGPLDEAEDYIKEQEGKVN